MIFSDRDLRRLIDEGKLVVEPFDPNSVQPSSIDLRVGHQFRVFRRKPVKTGTAQTILTFNDETKCYWKFAERLLVGFDRRQSRQQITFTI